MSVYEVGPFHVRAERLVLSYRGRVVPVGRKVVETLVALIESGTEGISKEALMERVWPNRFVEESNVAQNVYVLRNTFREHGVPVAIESVPGYGYRLAVAARRLPDEPHFRERRPLQPAWIPGAALLLATIPALLALNSDGVGGRASTSALSDEGSRLYAIGRYYWNLRTSDGVQRSMRYFERVLDRDPESPLGYVGMADANESMGDYCYGSHRPSVYFARARAFALQAISLDPGSAPAHATFGFVMLHLHQPGVALTELRRAIALDPSYAPGHEWYGIALARQNKRAEAWRELRSAARLDPLSVATMAWLSRLADRERRIGDAITYRAEAAEMSPELARRASPPEHPTWSSIENVEHLGPTVVRPAAYKRHESLIDPDGRRGAGAPRNGVVRDGAGGSYTQ